MPTYRRRKGIYDTWHWCTNCSNWPTKSGTYDTRYSKPTSDELCNQCKDKKRLGTCKT